jgi:PEGA domain-containing protein
MVVPAAVMDERRSLRWHEFHAIVASMRMALAILVAWSTVARADAPSEEEAVRHLNLGIAAYKQGHYDEALRELTETDRLAPDRANTHRWLALVQAKLGDCKAALLHVDAYMARVTGDDKRLPEIVALRDKCLGIATLVVQSTPDGANVHIDGGPIAGTTPHRAIGLRGGSHVIDVDKSGYFKANRAITMPPTGELVVSLELKPMIVRPERPWWPWAAAGVAVVAAVGVTALVLTRSHDNSLPPIVCDGGACK